MPVLRQSDNTLLIPSTRDRGWSIADPEYLIEQVRLHHNDWSFFRPIARVLKDWRLDITAETRIKSLVIEVLALQCLPRSGTRPEALRQFFSAAAVEVNLGVVDPAGYCGLIQSDLDTVALRDALLEAADLADLACDQAARNDTDGAQRAWQQMFGPDFPPPAKKTGAAGAGGACTVDHRLSAGLGGDGRWIAPLTTTDSSGGGTNPDVWTQAGASCRYSFPT